MGNSFHLLEFGLRWPPETFIRSKLEDLAERGITVSVGCTSRADGAAALRGIERVPVGQSYPAGLGSRLKSLWSLIAVLSRNPRRGLALFAAAKRPTGAGLEIDWRERVERLLAYARLQRTRADVVHFEWGSAAVHYDSLIDALASPAVISCHGDPRFHLITPTTRAVALAVPKAFARAAAVHCVSEAVRRDAVELGLDPAKAWLIRGGVDPNLFRPPTHKPTDKDHFSVVSVGDLRWLKGHEYALLAIAELARQGIPATLEIIGDDPGADHGELGQRTRILHTARHLGIHERVHLHGRLQPTEVSAQLRCADALLHTSLSEGLPNVVLEAMACGLPVVATNTGGTGEAIRDGIEGFLIPPRDPHAAANALTTLWHNPPLRQQMGHAGRTRAQTHFTLKHQTDQWITLYRRVIEAGE